MHMGVLGKRIKKAEKNWWASAATATAILYVRAQRYMCPYICTYIYVYIYIIYMYISDI